MSDQQQIIPPPRAQRGMVIRGLVPRLPERGKIKIGGLGEERKSKSGNIYRMPVKYEHFVITTLERDKQTGNFVRDEQMHARFGEAPTTLPVRLLYDDPTLNLISRYACFKGRTLWCVGDGQRAERIDDEGRHGPKGARYGVACTCPLADPTIKRGPSDLRCRPNGALSALIEGASGLGGVWKFRTTSWNAITELLSTMSFIRQVTGGPLANIPLLLTVRPRTAANPVDGSSVQIWVVGLEFAGDVAELQDMGHQIALARATTHLSIAHIEDEARRHLALLPTTQALPGDDDKIVDEFYPEQAEAAEGGGTSPPPRPRRAAQQDNETPTAQKPTGSAGSDMQETGHSPVSGSPPADPGPGNQKGDNAEVDSPANDGSSPSTEPARYHFADHVGEVHDFVDLEAACGAFYDAMALATDPKTLDALWENGQELMATATEEQPDVARSLIAEHERGQKRFAQQQQQAIAAQAQQQTVDNGDPLATAISDADAFLLEEIPKSGIQRAWLKMLQRGPDDRVFAAAMRKKRDHYERFAAAGQS